MKRTGSCIECGFDWEGQVGQLSEQLGLMPHELEETFAGREEAILRTRPEPSIWSPLEYAAHTRDVLAHIQALDEIVTIDPEIVSGTPVFKGTRVPIQVLLDHLEAGDPLGKFLDDFPSVTRQQAVRFIELAGEAVLSELARPA